MGYAFATALCFICNEVFSFNPHKVPSIKDKGGVKRPLCEGCVKKMQLAQKQRGFPVWPDPLPNAYQPIDETEL